MDTLILDGRKGKHGLIMGPEVRNIKYIILTKIILFELSDFWFSFV